MGTLRCVFTLAFIAAPTSWGTASASGICPLENIKSARALHDALNLRAVEIVQRATQADGADEQLAPLVSPSASFSIGAGDVGRPLGSGIKGARALAAAMNADTYVYLGWDYMDGPAQPCSSHTITVEFVNSRIKSLSRVEFTFEAGRLINASGWSRSFQTGALKSAPTGQ